ncbi:NAD(P)-dependent oxidoreductase [Gordonia sp. LSe1-13]|uniref:NAD(P)-dependent oxidoreductase n=1 Tax=Gordonia sesuvii TaxID=3116777 RepID=A0ABU7MA75_9ACTN|nr:NAD(P)-dependent oxidoreductase [Gordonia sp. LSe1-13]
MRIGFIGLGSQGGPMAQRIIDAGEEVTLWARRPATLEPFAASGAKVAGSPAEVGAASDIVCLCVVADDDVLEVAAGPDGVLEGLSEGGIIVVHSTVHPDTCRELAKRAARTGVRVVDAPVSGGGRGAESGTLLVMVGGADDDVAQCMPVLSTYGDPVVHLGDLGAGQTTKLLNNLLFTANMATVVDTLSLGASLGVEPLRLADVIAKGTARSFALESIAASGGTIERIAAHAGNLLRKDVGLVGDIAGPERTSGNATFTAAQATLDKIEVMSS